ncbi:MAG: DegT/DnrJ/EryC1/StrS family aminotransferase [Candidatus Taylorbacteria bacterium]|nr:DegT/DnrJ/EryC1/StrS family aminotransferase [Candidatus Taylorbacteria bacterium]
MPKYPLAKPYITKAEEQAVLGVLRSGNLSLGPKYKEFEKKFSEKIGTRYACAVSSGTAGLHLAMIAANIQPGDEVITSPFSFVASANCILYVGAKPVFVDIDPLTYNMDPDKIEQALTPKTKAILVVHIFGQAADMKRISKIAKKYNLKIIEDACESIYAKHDSKNVGTFGETAVFAFYPNKQMTTGEGGMIVTDNKKIYNLCASLRNQGRAENMQWLDHERLGYNYRLDEMSAALGIVQLAKLDKMIKTRQTIANWYNKYLAPHKQLIQTPQTAMGNTHTWFVYVVTLNQPKVNRDPLIVELAKRGISTKPYLPSIHLFSFYKDKFNYKKGDFPLAEKISNNSLALPFYVGLKENDVKYIVQTLINTINNHG